MKLSSYINTALCAAASCLPLANSHAAEHSVGAGINSLGLDLQYTQKQNWSLREGDQIQLRFAVSGIKFDDIDDADIDGTDYDIDLDLFSLRGGLDWYPFAGKRSDNFFFSGGLGYISSEFEARSEKNQNFSVGNTRINANDDFSLTIEGEQKSIAPYLSVGWGNRLREKGGLAFRTELGIFTALNDADIKLRADDPNNLVSDADLAKEKRSIENDNENIISFLQVGLSYRF